MRRILNLAVVALMASQGQAALAAYARAHTYLNTQTLSAAGFATASAADQYAFVNANAYEFRGGVGVFAFSGTGNIASPVFNSATADATFAETIRIGQSSNSAFHLFDTGDGTVFELTWSIQPSGDVSTSTTTYSGAVASYAGASYSYDWSFAGLGGSGQVYEQKNFSQVPTSGDTHSLLGGITYVHLGDVVTLNLHAHASASTLALPNAPASASAEFDHTLRWGGITAIRAFNAQGVEIDLPDGFDLALTSGDGAADYFAAAGPNPYTSPAPEPGEWAMMAAGLGIVGGMARRRRRATA